MTKDGVPGAAEVQAQMTAAVESVVDTCVQIAPWEELLKFARGWAAGTLDEGEDAAPAAATAEVKTVSGQEQAASGQGVEKGGAASGQGVEKGGAGLAKNDHSQFVNAQKEYKEVMQGHGATFHLALTVLRCLEPRGASIYKLPCMEQRRYVKENKYVKNMLSGTCARDVKDIYIMSIYGGFCTRRSLRSLR